MGTPSASSSITMRVHLGADPLGIGRTTTAVGEAAGTVVAVDIVESHPDSLVVDLTCNAADARHADTITRAVSEVEGALVHTISEQCLWTESHDTIDQLRQAINGFVDRYNTSWLIQRHGHQTPKEADQAAQASPAA